MANAQEGPNSGVTSLAIATTTAGRPPRLPRWTRQEILVLIEGKRVVEKRGRGRAGPGLGPVTPVEPKWASVSAYCKRHGVNRGPVQCRKRWSNLAGDYKKIKEWERVENNESFWGMRNDLRREKRLPGFFDRDVYDIIDSITSGTVSIAGGDRVEIDEDEEREELGEEKVFDSGRKDGGLFEDDEEDETEEKEEGAKHEPPLMASVRIPERIMFESTRPAESSEPGTSKQKQPADNTETDLPSLQETNKRRRTAEEEERSEREAPDIQTRLVQLLERNSRLVAAQLEAQNINLQLDRDQRKDQTNSLLGVLNKLTDVLGRIADKL